MTTPRYCPDADLEGLTARQRALLEVLDAQPSRLFDLAELAQGAGTSRVGIAATGSSLVRRGLARRVRFGGLVHYQARHADRP